MYYTLYAFVTITINYYYYFYYYYYNNNNYYYYYYYYYYYHRYYCISTQAISNYKAGADWLSLRSMSP